MSDKKEVGLNEVDIQAVIAAWIIAHDGCEGIYCTGDRGIFYGTVCPLANAFCCERPSLRAKLAKEWLKNYHQQKVEAAETEKQKVEAAKKQEQEAKQESKEICGNCKHTSESVGFKGVIPCEWRNTNVPAGNPGCHYFEPRNTTCQSPSVSSEDVADAVAYAERIAQLEKDNARLAEEVSGYKERARRALGLCEVIEMGINQDIKERKELQNQRNLAREDALRLEKENSNLSSKCERLTEQRNKLSNDLIQAMRRVKDVDVYCSLKARLVDQLRKKNAELQSALERAAEDRKRLEEQLSESEDNHLYATTNLYAYKPTAEEFLVIKGLYRQR